MSPHICFRHARQPQIKTTGRGRLVGDRRERAGWRGAHAKAKRPPKSAGFSERGAAPEDAQKGMGEAAVRPPARERAEERSLAFSCAANDWKRKLYVPQNGIIPPPPQAEYLSQKAVSKAGTVLHRSGEGGWCLGAWLTKAPKQAASSSPADGPAWSSL